MAWLAIAACDRPARTQSDAPALRRDLRAACDSGVRYPYFLDLRRPGQYVVNTENMDSTRLLHWLKDRVRTYPKDRRRLVIERALSQNAVPAWLTDVARNADVTVYEFLPQDSVCYPPIH